MKASLVFASAGIAALVGCAAEPSTSSNLDNIPTWEEFVASTHQMEDGTYIVNGDEPIEDLDGLRNFYDDIFFDGELIINTVGGSHDKWSASQARNLTYCVSTRFGADHGRVVDAIAQGAALWEGAGDVDFIYVASADGNCTTRNNAVLFSVEPTNDPSLYARAFFPSYSDRKRNVLINAKNTFNGDYVPRNILGHELGHTLGFRHEHTRPEAGSECYENSSWASLTPYDNASIMHYPWCGNADPNRALTWSQLDAQGTGVAYP